MGWLLIRWAFISGVVIALLAYLVSMPGSSYHGPFNPLTKAEADSRDRLKATVYTLSGQIGDRSTKRFQGLADSARYIERSFSELGLTVTPQTYQEEGMTVSNLIVEIRGSTLPDQIVTIGAHYDSVPGCPA